MPDSSDIDAALVSKLGADAALLNLMKNGVYVDQAPPGSERFVIISLVEEVDDRQFGGRSHEDALYLVKAVALSTATPPVGASISADAKSAAARIDALLEGGTLTVAGYTLMALHRESRIRITEVDDVDPAIRWFHRGGQYRLVMST
jgi:hypothetical protein